jgi:glycosyltransferase 2 family protein
MQGLFSALGRGFNRWIGWKRLGVAASLLVISFAISTLMRMLKSIDASVILTVLEDIATPYRARCALGGLRPLHADVP